jgi:hypothetical protein
MRKEAFIGCVAAACVVAVWAGDREAWAISPAESVLRRELIGQAEAAHAAGDHATALERAKRAGALEMTTSLRYFLAREQEEAGAVSEGYASAEQCEVDAEHDPKLRNRDTILQACRAIKSRLAGRIGRVQITFAERPPGLKVRIAGQDVSDAAIGLPYIVTPGTITVEATAPDRLSFREQIKVGKGQTVTRAIELAPKPAESPAAATPALPSPGVVAKPSREPAATPARTEAIPTAPPPPAPKTVEVTATQGLSPPSPSPARPRYDLYVAGTGGVLLIAGTVSYLLSGSEFSSIKSACNSVPQQNCTVSRRNDSITKIQTLDRLAVGAWIAGGALAVVGLFHHYLARPSEDGGDHATIGIDPISRALIVESRF